MMGERDRALFPDDLGEPYGEIVSGERIFICLPTGNAEEK